MDFGKKVQKETSENDWWHGEGSKERKSQGREREITCESRWLSVWQSEE